MPLTTRQHSALATLEWLLSPNNRREGRTMAIAVATIRVAAARPGVRIPYTDHAGVDVARVNLSQTIEDLVRGDPRIAAHALISRECLTLQLPRPIFEWLPPEIALSTLSARQAGRAAAERFDRPEDSLSEHIAAEIERQVNARLQAGARVSGININVQNERVDRELTPQELAAQREFNEMHSIRPRPPNPEEVSEDIFDSLSHLFEINQQVVEEPTPSPTPVKAEEPKPAPKPRAPKAPKVPKSAWDRLLDDED